MRHYARANAGATVAQVVAAAQDWQRWVPALGVTSVEPSGSTFAVALGGPRPFRVRLAVTAVEDGVAAVLVEGDVPALELRVRAQAEGEGTSVELTLDWQPPGHLSGALQATIGADLLPRALAALMATSNALT